MGGESEYPRLQQGRLVMVISCRLELEWGKDSFDIIAVTDYGTPCHKVWAWEGLGMAVVLHCLKYSFPIMTKWQRESGHSCRRWCKLKNSPKQLVVHPSQPRNGWESDSLRCGRGKEIAGSQTQADTEAFSPANWDQAVTSESSKWWNHRSAP